MLLYDKYKLTGEDSPVVGVVFVHVSVELLCVEALFLAHLAGQVVRLRQRRVQLKHNTNRVNNKLMYLIIVLVTISN